MGWMRVRTSGPERSQPPHWSRETVPKFGSERAARISTLRGLGGGRRQAAEAALARAEFRNRRAKLVTPEIRPHGVGENQLRVGALPEQKIREPLLAASPDHEVDVAPRA